MPHEFGVRQIVILPKKAHRAMINPWSPCGRAGEDIAWAGVEVDK